MALMGFRIENKVHHDEERPAPNSHPVPSTSDFSGPLAVAKKGVYSSAGMSVSTFVTTCHQPSHFYFFLNMLTN